MSNCRPFSRNEKFTMMSLCVSCIVEVPVIRSCLEPIACKVGAVPSLPSFSLLPSALPMGSHLLLDANEGGVSSTVTTWIHQRRRYFNRRCKKQSCMVACVQ